MLAFIIFASLSFLINSNGFTDKCSSVTESVFLEGSDGWTGGFGSVTVQNGCAKILQAPDTAYRSLHFIAPVPPCFDIPLNCFDIPLKRSSFVSDLSV